MHASANHHQHLIIALIAGALLVALVRIGADKLLVPYPVTPAQTVLVPSQATPQESSMPATAVPNPAEQQTRQARIERERILAEQDRQKRERKQQEAIAARDQAAEAAHLEQEQMDQAWSRFYKKPKKCDSPTEQAVIVECSNHFIRERQRFEKRWAEGKLSSH